MARQRQKKSPDQLTCACNPATLQPLVQYTQTHTSWNLLKRLKSLNVACMQSWVSLNWSCWTDCRCHSYGIEMCLDRPLTFHFTCQLQLELCVAQARISRVNANSRCVSLVKSLRRVEPMAHGRIQSPSGTWQGKAARPLTWPLTYIIFFPIHFTCKAQLGRAFGKPQKLQFVRVTKWHSVKCRAKVKEEGFFYFLPV